MRIILRTFLISSLWLFPLISDAMSPIFYESNSSNPLTQFLNSAGQTAYGQTTTPEPAVVIGNIVKQVLLLTGVILFAIFVYAGLIWMTASGSEERVTKAKNLLQNAFWGMLITGGAYILAAFVTQRVFQAATGT